MSNIDDVLEPISGKIENQDGRFPLRRPSPTARKFNSDTACKAYILEARQYFKPFSLKPYKVSTNEWYIAFRRGDAVIGFWSWMGTPKELKENTR